MSGITKAAVLTATAGAALVASGGMAFADSGTNGAAANSPGVLSGNVIQVPVHIPINLCGNTINAAGFINPAVGNTCVNA